MASLNACCFTGRLGRAPELRQIPSGKSVCSFSLAVDGFGKDAETLWLDVSVWGAAGETTARYLGKGSEAAVTGRIGLRTYEKKDGTMGAAVTLDARDISFIGPKVEAPTEASPAKPDAESADDDWLS